MKFLRSIRFDGSDDHVFELASEAGQWAVSGAFAFADMEPAEVVGKTKQAFANGFLGLGSFGRSTFAVVSEITAAELEDVERMLAAHFVARYGAPDDAAALPVARRETAFILDLCAEPLVNTIFTVRRSFDDRRQVHEAFRTMRAPADGPQHARIWSAVEDDA